MNHSAHQKEVRFRLLTILSKNVDNEWLNPSDFDFVMSVLKHHPHFKEKAGTGVLAITTIQHESCSKNKDTVKKFALITADGKVNEISHKKAMRWETPQTILIKKLTYFAKRMQKKMIFEFREGDQICEKTWKKVPEGLEKVTYINKTSLRQLCIAYLKELDDDSKQLLLAHEVQAAPSFIRWQWRHFLKKQQPLVVHIAF